MPAPKSKTTIRGARQLWHPLQTITASDGSTQTTRLMETPQGVVLSTCTRCSTGVAQALVFIPGARRSNFPAA